MAVQLEDKYRGKTIQFRSFMGRFILVLWMTGLLFTGALLPVKMACSAELRKELQQAYETYKQSELHYKVFALKHEGNRWDGWYTWGYNDLDQAILDAVHQCNKGTNVSGKCQVYGLGNEVVVGLEPLQLQAKIEAYRISGMVNRSYPKPAARKLVSLGFSGDGHYFAGLLPESAGSRLFIYDISDKLWKHTFVLATDLPLQANRSFSLSHDGKLYAFARYAQSLEGKGKSTIVVKGWGDAIRGEIPLENGAFWNGGCGVALSSEKDEVAVCVDDGVITRVIRYEISSGKKRGEINSSKLKGKFDRTVEYSPDGQFLLVRGGRYQFDWVLKKKGKEAELAWIVSVKTGKIVKTLEFPLGLERKGPEDIHFSGKGHTLIVTTTDSIILDSMENKKVFRRRSSTGSRTLLSPHGVLAIVDGSEISRFNIVDHSLVPIDSEPVSFLRYQLGFDYKDDCWRMVSGQEMAFLSAFRQADLQAVGLYKDAEKMLEKGKYSEAMVALSLVDKKIPDLSKLSSELSAYKFYLKYPDIPLASLGTLYVRYIQKILDMNRKVSRLGFGYVKDPKSGLLFTTVQRIDPGTSVSRSDIQVGDRITHVNGTPVILSSQMNNVLAPLSPGTRVVLTFMRHGHIFKDSVVTEEGFQDTGKAAHVLLMLFDYGQLAAQAGHPGLVRLAAVRLREISGQYPSSFRMDLVERLAVSLEALAFSVEGNMEAAFELLERSAPHPFQFRLFNLRVWGTFYADRHRLAQAIGVPPKKLPKFDGIMIRKNQDYPDLNGLLIPAITLPPLVR